jgi:hypothetical protein
MRMTDATPKPKAAWLAALIQQRSRRGWWAYVIWLLVYLPLVMFFAGEMSFHSGARVAQMWPLLVPIVILIVQWARPTVLGWIVVFLPTLLYFGVGVYYIITNNLGAHPQWEHDSEGVILGSFFLAALLAVCIVLIFAARPRALHETRAT